MSTVFELFLDYETTGFSSLEIEDGKIVDKIREKGLMEVGAVLVTRDYQTELGEISIMIDPGEAYTQMNEATRKFHEENGYITVWEKSEKQTCAQAEKALIDMINTAVFEKTGEYLKPIYDYGNDIHIVLAGRSVHTDRKWMDIFMPRLSIMLHHRHNDVSVLRSYLGNSPLGTPYVSSSKPNHFAIDDARLALNDARCIQSLVTTGVNSVIQQGTEYSSLEKALVESGVSSL